MFLDPMDDFLNEHMSSGRRASGSGTDPGEVLPVQRCDQGRPLLPGRVGGLGGIGRPSALNPDGARPALQGPERCGRWESKPGRWGPVVKIAAGWWRVDGAGPERPALTRGLPRRSGA